MSTAARSRSSATSTSCAARRATTRAGRSRRPHRSGRTRRPDMTKRDSWIVPLLSMVTCGIYGMWWHYQSTEELKVVSGRSDLSGVMDVLLSLVTCGVYFWYAEYRNAQIVTELLASRG